jgi:hypothetical protein
MRGDCRAAADELDGRVLLFGGDDGDLDQQPRVGELGLDAGAAGQILPARADARRPPTTLIQEYHASFR